MSDKLAYILSSLANAGIVISLGEGDKLVLQGPPNSINDELRRELSTNRNVIRNYLLRRRLPKDLDSVTIARLEHGPIDGATVFCFHAFQGTVVFYRPLASVLSAHADVYGVQALGVDLLRNPLPSVIAMAAYYAEQISKFTFQPIFIGWCAGSIFALETAKQLRENGKPVKRVICADPWLGGVTSTDQIWKKFLEVYLSERSAEDAFSESVLLSRSERLGWLAEQRGKRSMKIKVQDDLDNISRRLEFWETMDHSLRGYQFKSHSEQIKLYLSQKFAKKSMYALAQYDVKDWSALKQCFSTSQGFIEMGHEILNSLD